MYSINECKIFWYNFFGAFHLLKKRIEDRIELFKKKDENELDDFLIRVLCCESIILDISKITSPSNTNQTGFRELKSILSNLQSNEIKQRMEQLIKLEKDNEQLFKKIEVNRDKFIAHLDIFKDPYYNYGFSQGETERIIDRMYGTFNRFMYKDIAEFLEIKENAKKQLLESEQKKQRYSISDLMEDIPLFEGILKDLFKIYFQINIIMHNL